MEKLLIIGSTCVDVVLRVPHLPTTGEDIQPQEQRFSLGGCGWNVFRAARLTGADPVFLSPVGTGVYGDLVSRAMETEGIPVLARTEEANGCCYCLVEDGGERTFLSVHGGEYSIRRPWLDRLPGPFSLAYVCGMELQEDTGEDILDWLTAHRETEIFYAPGPRGVLIPAPRQDRMLDLGPILHLNEGEAAVLSGVNDPAQAAEQLGRRTGNLVVITLGPEGCLYRAPDGELGRVPAPAVTVCDTIGAGDTHAGVLLGCLHQHRALPKALALANAAAADTVTRPGAEIPKTLGGLDFDGIL